MIGQDLAHFRITAKLGEGGMGEVYRAQDTKLQREVALKVLSAEMAEDEARLERFQREARAVAALNHPNIVTVYSVEEADGYHFITMELVEGHSLAEEIPEGGLTLDRFFDIGTELAGAVAAAHEKAITHRDLKPANVMLTRDGRVKVLDFGLAKLADTAQVPEQTRMPTEAITQEGMVVGTIPYMSPEQIEGKPIAESTDIFSLGVLLYEMLTGSRPFHGDTQPALMSSILRDVPPQVLQLRAELPRHLDRILQRCLEKSPQHRYQSAVSLAYELDGLRAESESGDSAARSPAQSGQISDRSEFEEGQLPDRAAVTPQEKTIAVLPFVNRSSNPDDQYFSDGLSEELISALGSLPGLRVIARSSAFQFRGQELDVREVGRKLGVEAVLEGSVRIAGKRLRITTELVNCADGYQIWSERFDGEMKDIFDTQDEIVQAIVDQFEVEIGSKDDVAVARRDTENLDAYHLVLKARHRLADFQEPGVGEAIGFLERAVEIDPEYAIAYTEIAWCYVIRSIFGSLSGAEAFPKIRAAVLEALELDPELGDAHGMYGLYLAWHDFDWERSEEELRLAIELSPQNVWNHFYYAGVLATSRRGDDILGPAGKLRTLDPLNPGIHAHLPLFLFYAGRGTEAIAEVEKSIELFPDFWFNYYELSFFRWQERDLDGAIDSMSKAVEMTDRRVGFMLCFLAAMYFYSGQDEEGERWMARVTELAKTAPVSSIGYTVVDVVRKNTDAAVEWMERGRAEHDTLFVWTRAFCEQQDIIADERIREAMERLGLP